MKTTFNILLLLLPTYLFAQQKLNGTVSDRQGKLLDAATVTLSQNGNVMSSQLADQGKFILTGLKPAEYQLSVSLIGYKAVIRKFTLPKDSLKLILEGDSKQLKEVAVTYRKPTIERKVDRVVFNVENSILAAGGSTWEALSKAPGVQTGQDGTITTNKKRVTVYMDDKPVRLSGDDLTTYLKSIPADQISKIEVMTNPSSKYEADGVAVINIVSKKIKADGFNASLNGGYSRGARNRYTGSGIFNYRKDKLNVFGSYGYSLRDTRWDVSGFTVYQTPENYSYWDRDKVSLGENKNHNYKVGVDYNLTDNQVIGFLVTGNNGRSSSDANTLTNVFNNYQLSPDSVLHTANHSNGYTNQYSFNANYKVKLDTSGRNLNFDIDYVPYRDGNTQNLNNLTDLANGSQSPSAYQISTPTVQKINIWSGKLDYEDKLWKNWSLESGLKYTGISSENQLDFFDTGGINPILNQSKSDHFKYTENTEAAYTSISGEIGKWTFKGGLRAEYTRAKGYSVSLDSVNTNNYLKLFPTAFISYKASDNDEFGFTYAKRIARPGYSQLNPAKYYSTPYSYQNGNPFLRPSFSNSAELSYTFKKQYTVTASITQMNDLASNATVQDNVNKTFYDTQVNIGGIRDLAIGFQTSSHLTSWWEMNNSADLYYRTQKADYLQGSYNYHGFLYHLSTNHSFTIDKKSGLKAETNAWYESGGQQGTLHVYSFYDVSAGISKSVLNKQGTIRFSTSDILNTNGNRLGVDYLDQHNGTSINGDTRTFTLGFSYKLGKNIAAARRRSTAAEDEKSRTNN